MFNQKIVFYCSLASFSLSASAGLSIMMSVKCAFISVLPDFKITFNSALTRAPSSLEDFLSWILGEVDLLVGELLAVDDGVSVSDPFFRVDEYSSCFPSSSVVPCEL